MLWPEKDASEQWVQSEGSQKFGSSVGSPPLVVSLSTDWEPPSGRLKLNSTPSLV